MNLRCLKLAIPAGIILWALFLWPVLAQPVYLEVCLSITGTRAEARVGIRALGLGKEILSRDEDNPGQFLIVGIPPHAQLEIMPVTFPIHWAIPEFDQDGNVVVDQEGNPVIDIPAVYPDFPIIRIRFISAEARGKAAERFFGSPAPMAGLAKTDCPNETRIWAGDRP